MKLNDQGWSRTLNAKYSFIISTDNFLCSYPQKLSTFSIRIFELDLVILQFMNAKDKNFLKDVWNIFGTSQKILIHNFLPEKRSITTNIGFRVFYQYCFFFSIKSLDIKSKYFYFPANCCYIFQTILTKR